MKMIGLKADWIGKKPKFYITGEDQKQFIVRQLRNGIDGMLKKGCEATGRFANVVISCALWIFAGGTEFKTRLNVDGCAGLPLGERSGRLALAIEAESDVISANAYLSELLADQARQWEVRGD